MSGLSSVIISTIGVLAVVALYVYTNYRLKDIGAIQDSAAANLEILQKNNNPNLYDVVDEQLNELKKKTQLFENSYQKNLELYDKMTEIIETQNKVDEPKIDYSSGLADMGIQIPIRRKRKAVEMADTTETAETAEMVMETSIAADSSVDDVDEEEINSLFD